MALQSSGPISNNDIAGEFGGSTPHSLSEYYRNGSLVPGNNTNVPTSGTIRLSDFYGAVNEIIVNISASATDVNANTLFGTNWGSSVPKRLIINSGVTVGGVSAAALTLNGSMGGTLVVENNGSIQGFGGASNGGNGGNAIQADQTASVTITNNSGGQIYAGGGGGGQGGSGGPGGAGGQGGTGGGGQATTSSEPGGTPMGLPANCNSRCVNNYGSGSICVGNCTFQSLPPQLGGGFAMQCHLCRVFTTTNTSGGAGGAGGAGSTSGGAGGTGGRGRGYNQTQQNGSSGSAGPSGSAGSSGSSGGTNAGTGGTGGTGGSGGTGGTGGNGGDWGTNGTGGSTGSTGATGNTGATGANGNRTNGSAGSAGSNGSSGSGGSGAGSAGIYITNRSSLTFTNNGAVAGV